MVILFEVEELPRLREDPVALHQDDRPVFAGPRTRQAHRLEPAAFDGEQLDRRAAQRGLQEPHVRADAREHEATQLTADAQELGQRVLRHRRHRAIRAAHHLHAPIELLEIARRSTVRDPRELALRHTREP